MADFAFYNKGHIMTVLITKYLNPMFNQLKGLFSGNPDSFNKNFVSAGAMTFENQHPTFESMTPEFILAAQKGRGTLDALIKKCKQADTSFDAARLLTIPEVKDAMNAEIKMAHETGNEVNDVIGEWVKMGVTDWNTWYPNDSIN